MRTAFSESMTCAGMTTQNARFGALGLTRFDGHLILA